MLGEITMTPSTFGELIREGRLAKGMSMGQLASAVGRTAASVRRWERDEVLPAADVVQRLAEVLDIDPDDLAVHPSPPGDDEESGDDAMPPTPGPGVETDAMPVPVVEAVTTVSPEIDAEPPAETRGIGYYVDHLFDPDRPYLGYLRATLTVVVALILLWILVWAVGELFEALGRVWDQFSRDETDTTEAAVSVRMWLV
jgi:transcriptional regulator with XRE-family HTH domain